jgi:ABC-type uncharacterized transport system permease subunit
MNHLPLLASTLFYFLSCCSAVLSFRSGEFRAGRFNVITIALGVIAQSCFLIQQGEINHACPIRTLPEIIIFLSWAIGIFYLVIGTTYRISLMGTFTAPLILGLQSIAFLLPAEKIPSMIPMNPWIETHAALSLVAFGAFGLSCISGMMFLVQERQLKSQHPDPIFHHLPPIRILEEATIRLLWMGLILLTISFAAGWIASHSILGLKFWISLLIWGAYSLVLFLNQKHRLTGHRLALSVIIIFFFSLLVLPLIGYVSDLALR